MTSPYSSDLLQHSTHDDADEHSIEEGAVVAPSKAATDTEKNEDAYENPLDAPRYTADTRPAYVPPASSAAAPAPIVRRPVAQPVHYQLPVTPQYMQPAAAPRSGSAVTAMQILVLGLITLLLGAVALIGGYYLTRALQPDAALVNAETRMAGEEGYISGRTQGLSQGVFEGRSQAQATSKLNSSLQKQRAWNSAYDRGLTAGEKAYRRPAPYRGYRGGYAPRLSFPNYNETYAALGAAQSIANATGAPVDVEIYN